jgi:hypothetical protein
MDLDVIESSTCDTVVPGISTNVDGTVIPLYTTNVILSYLFTVVEYVESITLLLVGDVVPSVKFHSVG